MSSRVVQFSVWFVLSWLARRKSISLILFRARTTTTRRNQIFVSSRFFLGSRIESHTTKISHEIAHFLRVPKVSKIGFFAILFSAKNTFQDRTWLTIEKEYSIKNAILLLCKSINMVRFEIPAPEESPVPTVETAADTEDNLSLHGDCLKCHKKKISYECDPCGCPSFCTDCARKLASGGKCKTCHQLYGGLRRVRVPLHSA